MLELNKIYHGDCLELLKQIDDKSIDMVLTDPPYSINFQSGHRKEKFDLLVNDNNLLWLEECINEIYRILKNNTHFYCFCRWDVYHKFYEVISKKFNIKNCLIIKRVNTSMGDLKGQFAYFYEMCIFCHKGRRTFNETNLIKKNGKSHQRFKGDTSVNGYIKRYPDLIDFIPSGENRYLMEHPTQKSEAICRLFILLSSNKNEVILDPFMGSGTTLVVCKQTDRKFIGFEIDEKYFNISLERIRHTTDSLNRWLIK